MLTEPLASVCRALDCFQAELERHSSTQFFLCCEVFMSSNASTSTVDSSLLASVPHLLGGLTAVDYVTNEINLDFLERPAAGSSAIQTFNFHRLSQLSTSSLHPYFSCHTGRRLKNNATVARLDILSRPWMDSESLLADFTRLKLS